MKKFLVTVPVTGSISIEVEAESEDKALAAFYEEYDENRATYIEDLEWEFCEKIIEGNVCHVSGPWETEIEEQ